MYDSLHSSVEDMTVKLRTNLFGENTVIEMGNSSQQDVTTDYGVFAITTCIALATSGRQPERFPQESMRVHLVKYSNKCSFSTFSR